ncbi:MAG: hypothetical protein GX601_14200 [Anaerolineales bacterium]|nr:hypothetical protein [Anaerolineales bacterium]
MVYTRWAAYALMVLTLAPIGLALFYLIRSRRGSIYATRRSAAKRAALWLLISVIVLAVALLLLLVPPTVSDFVPVVTPSATPTATATAAPPPVRTPTPTSTPTAPPAATSTRRPTATPPPIPTATSGVVLPEDVLTPLPSAVPAPPEAKIELLALATEKDSNDEPVEPASEFPEGQHPVILFFHYTAMSDGAQVTFAYYRNDALMEDCTDTWLWGLAEDRDWGQTGWAALECNPPEGWEPGSYDIRVFIESRLQGTAQFVIAEP